MDEARLLEGFLFTVTTPDGARREVRLQGSGGEIGGGCLAAHNTMLEERRPAYLERVLADALACARHEALQTGAVRTLDHDAEDYRDRIASVAVRSVDAVRGLFWPREK